MNLNNPTTTAIIQAETLVGATGTSPAVTKVSPWLSTVCTNILHYGFKFYNDLPGGSSAVIYCTFVFRMFVSARKIA
jgi:hypothetical protein